MIPTASFLFLPSHTHHEQMLYKTPSKQKTETICKDRIKAFLITKKLRFYFKPFCNRGKNVNFAAYNLFIMLYYIKRSIVWLRRAHRSKGFGVQSPWAYRFIRYVVNEPYPYYKYEHLKSRCMALTKRLVSYANYISAWRNYHNLIPLSIATLHPHAIRFT